MENYVLDKKHNDHLFTKNCSLSQISIKSVKCKLNYMSKFSISCNTQSSKFTVTVDSEHIWNSETQNQTWH